MNNVGFNGAKGFFSCYDEEGLGHEKHGKGHLSTQVRNTLVF